jgi:hypothetical protein
MSSLKQIAANRANALKSTGPRTAKGKERSRQNAMRHGLTAETVITAFERAADYQALETALFTDYQPASATEHQLISRLASVLWRLRRATSIETGLFQIEGELMRQRNAETRARNIPQPEWNDELDAVSVGDIFQKRETDRTSPSAAASCQSIAECFLQVSRLGYGSFYLLSRYEGALWRQAAQLLLILGSPHRRARKSSKATTRGPDEVYRSPERAVVRLLCPPKRSRS